MVTVSSEHSHSVLLPIYKLVGLAKFFNILITLNSINALKKLYPKSSNPSTTTNS